MAVKARVKQIWGAREIDAPILARRPLLNKGVGQVDST